MIKSEIYPAIIFFIIIASFLGLKISQNALIADLISKSILSVIENII